MEKIFNTNDILKALRDGATPDDIASSMANALNTAMADYDAEKKAEEEAKAKAEAEKNAKLDAAEALAAAINDYAVVSGVDYIATPDDAANYFDSMIAANKMADLFVETFSDMLTSSDKNTRGLRAKTDPVTEDIDTKIINDFLRSIL